MIIATRSSCYCWKVIVFFVHILRQFLQDLIQLYRVAPSSLLCARFGGNYTKLKALKTAIGEVYLNRQNQLQLNLEFAS